MGLSATRTGSQLPSTSLRTSAEKPGSPWRRPPGTPVVDGVDHWLQDVSPGAHLQLESVLAADAVIAGFVFERPGDVATRRHRATNVGSGLSYVLPVVLALLSPRGSLCLIENPEAHLHPRRQTRLAELSVRAAGAGVQVFVKTHSDHFMDGVRIAVRDGLIAPADAAIHYSNVTAGARSSRPRKSTRTGACRTGRPGSSISTTRTWRDYSPHGAAPTHRIPPRHPRQRQRRRRRAPDGCVRSPGSPCRTGARSPARARTPKRSPSSTTCCWAINATPTKKLARMADPERLRTAADRARKAGPKPSDWL